MSPLMCLKRSIMPFLAFGAVLIGGFSLGLMPIPGQQVAADVAQPGIGEDSPRADDSAREIMLPYSNVASQHFRPVRTGLCPPDRPRVEGRPPGPRQRFSRSRDRLHHGVAWARKQRRRPWDCGPQPSAVPESSRLGLMRSNTSSQAPHVC